MRTYKKTHSWLTFQIDLRLIDYATWISLGEAQSKCEHISGVPLRPSVAQQLHLVYLAKGVLATTAIEGNTLTESEVIKHLEGKLKLPPSKEYLAKEIDNIIAACDKIATDIAREIPLGEGRHNLPLDSAGLETVVNKGVAGIPTLARRSAHRAWDAFDPDQFADDLQRIEENGCLPADLAAVPKNAIQKGSSQLGTLGGGNHFIEIQYVQHIFDAQLAKSFGLFENQIVVMIHSGSRRFGRGGSRFSRAGFHWTRSF